MRLPDAFRTSSDNGCTHLCAQSQGFLYIYSMDKAQPESIEISAWIRDKLDTETVDAAPLLGARAEARYHVLKAKPGATEVWKKQGVGRPLRVVWHEKRESDEAAWVMQADDERAKPTG